MAAAGSCWVPVPVTPLLPPPPAPVRNPRRPGGPAPAYAIAHRNARLRTGMRAVAFPPPVNDSRWSISAWTGTASRCEGLIHRAANIRCVPCRESIHPDPLTPSLTLGLASINEMLAERYEQRAEVYLSEWACLLPTAFP